MLINWDSLVEGQQLTKKVQPSFTNIEHKLTQDVADSFSKDMFWFYEILKEKKEKKMALLRPEMIASKVSSVTGLQVNTPLIPRLLIYFTFILKQYPLCRIPPADVFQQNMCCFHVSTKVQQSVLTHYSDAEEIQIIGPFEVFQCKLGEITSGVGGCHRRWCLHNYSLLPSLARKESADESALIAII